MRKKFNINKEKLFQIINTVIIVGILSFYITRLFLYKYKLDVVYNDSSYTTLSQVVIARNDMMSEDRLYENTDGSYTYKGKINNNYCLFDNILYRIISIDKDGNIRLVSENNITNLTMSENNTFENSSMYRWLNKTEEDEHSGIFYNIITNKSYLNKSKANYKIIDDIKDYQSVTQSEADVTILSVEDYINAGSKDSFLANGQSFWLSNCTSEYQYYYVDKNGAIGSSYSSSMFIGVRPVITLASSTVALSGQGTADDPYVLTQHHSENISQCKVGDYISYSNLTWKIESFDEDNNAHLILDGLIQQDNETYKRYFGSVNYLRNNGGIGKYLNEDFLNTLSNYENYLIYKSWNFGTFRQIDNFDYSYSYNSTYDGYVSIPTIGNLFLNEYLDYFLGNNSIQSNDLIFIASEDILYANLISDEAAIRPMICMNKSIKIMSGSGTSNDPYQLEVINNE